MPRPLRHTPRGHMVEITLRTIQGRLLLRPTPLVTRILTGVIGRAQRKSDMEIHAVVAMGNHLHLLVTPQSAWQMARFMNHVGANIARKIGKLVGWREKFWGRRYRAIVVSNEEVAQVARLRYLLAHGCKEGFVPSPQDWPGLHAVPALVDGSMRVDGTWLDASAAYRDRQAGREKPSEAYEQPETIHFSPLPCWKDLTASRYQRSVAEMVESIEEGTRTRHRAAETAPTGVSFVLAVHPHETPRTAKRSPAPDSHAATEQARLHLRDAYAAFVVRFREAAEALRRGDWPLCFPSGCFPPALPFVAD